MISLHNDIANIILNFYLQYGVQIDSYNTNIPVSFLASSKHFPALCQSAVEDNGVTIQVRV